MAQKCKNAKKKLIGRNVLHSSTSTNPKNPTNKGSPLSWFFQTIWKTFRLEWINSKLATQYIFLKNIQILEVWKPTEDIKFNLKIQFFFSHGLTHIWTQYRNCFGHLIGTSLKYYSFWGQKFKKISRKRLKI